MRYRIVALRRRQSFYLFLPVQNRTVKMVFNEMCKERVKSNNMLSRMVMTMVSAPPVPDFNCVQAIVGFLGWVKERGDTRFANR